MYAHTDPNPAPVTAEQQRQRYALRVWAGATLDAAMVPVHEGHEYGPTGERDMYAQHRMLARMERDALIDCRRDQRPDCAALHVVVGVDPSGCLRFRRPSGATGLIDPSGALVP